VNAKTDIKAPAWPCDGSPEEIFRRASEAMKGDHPLCGTLVVAWYSRNEKGSGTLRYLHTTDDGAHLTALLSDLSFENHIARRSIFGNGNTKVDEVYPNLKQSNDGSGK
jgi:hypothetical protein